MTKKYIASSLVIFGLVVGLFPSCQKRSVESLDLRLAQLSEKAVQNNLVKFELSTSGDELRLLSFDSKNLAQGKYPRLEEGKSYAMRAYIFKKSGSRYMMAGYVDLTWKSRRNPNTGLIEMSCYGTFPVKAVKFVSGAYQELTTAVILTKGEKIKLVGIMGDGKFESEAPSSKYENKGIIGPRYVFDPLLYTDLSPRPQLTTSSGEVTQTAQVAMPYILHHDVTVHDSNYIRHLSQTEGALKIRPATPLLKLVIENGTGRDIEDSDKFELRTKGLSPAFLISYMAGLTQLGPKLYVGVSDANGQSGSAGVEWMDVKLPINLSGLKSGGKATFYVPVSLANGDAKNVGSVEVEFGLEPSAGGSIVLLDGKTKTTYNQYRLSETSEIAKHWLNSGSHYKMNTLSIYLEKSN